VKLGGAKDGRRDRAGLDELLLTSLAGVVTVVLDAIHADYGEDHVMPHPGASLGRQQRSVAIPKNSRARAGSPAFVTSTTASAPAIA